MSKDLFQKSFRKIQKFFPRTIQEQNKFVLEQFQNKSFDFFMEQLQNIPLKCPI